MDDGFPPLKNYAKAIYKISTDKVDVGIKCYHCSTESDLMAVNYMRAGGSIGNRTVCPKCFEFDHPSIVLAMLKGMK